MYCAIFQVVTAKRACLTPKKVENLVVIKENLSKLEDFKSNTSYKIDVSKVTSKENPFNKMKLVECDILGDVVSADVTDEFVVNSDSEVDESDVDDIEID